jgi:RNA polymerase sigma-70 factor (ECF subfamily)
VKAQARAGSGTPECADVRFAAAVRAYQPALTSLAFRLCRERADASDIVQDTFERAWRAWDRLPEDANVRAWLVTILNRLFIDRFRQARRAPTVDIDHVELPCPEPAEVPAWANVTSEQVGAALAGLDAEFRAAYELHAIDGRSYLEIAEALRIPRSTVGTRLLRARRKLRELLVVEVEAGRGGRS